MRQTILYVLAATLLLAGCSGKRVPVTVHDGADIAFDTLSHDFGEIPKGEKRSFDFVFHNIGSEPLVIHYVNPTCGCIREEHPARPIMPGRSGRITAIYDDDYALPGHFHKALGVHSNAKSGFVWPMVDGDITKNP